MVRGSDGIATIAVLFAVFVLSGFEKIDGPRFFNATAHEVTLQVTFAGGYKTPIPMPASSHFTFSDEWQVIAIRIEEDGAVRADYSGDMLPKVPADLDKPYRQLWVIEDGRICVLPERILHRDGIPKC